MILTNMSEKDEFFRYFREIQVKFSRFYTQLLTREDLTLPQYALLNELSRSGSMSMTDASARLFISKPAITNLVDKLEENKFLKREADPKDRRIYLLEIQGKGKRIVQEVQNQVFKYLVGILDQFKESDRRVIINFYASIANTMDEFLMKTAKTGANERE